jgi:hypothetical protein
MSRLSSATGATIEIYAQIKKAAIGAHGPAALKAAPAADAVPYLHIVLERSTTYAAAAVVLFGLLSPITATAQQRTVILTHPWVSAAATDDTTHAAVEKHHRHGAMPLTAQLPWLAPVGHRQPRRDDVPQDEAFAARERQQLRLNKELDQRLIICRGC